MFKINDPFVAGAIFVPLSFAIAISASYISVGIKEPDKIVEQIADLSQLTESERENFLKHLSYKECVRAIGKIDSSTRNMALAINKACTPILD